MIRFANNIFVQLLWLTTMLTKRQYLIQAVVGCGLTDRQTDGRTDGRTDGHPSESWVGWKLESRTCCTIKNKLCGRPPQYESGFRVTCDVGYLCANFSLPRPLCSRLKPDVRDRQTSNVRQTSDAQHRLIPIP